MILNYILNLIIIIENIQLMSYCAHICAVAKKLKFFRRTIYYRNIRRWYII